MDAISRLLKPRSVAVVGASADSAKTAGRLVEAEINPLPTGQGVRAADGVVVLAAASQAASQAKPEVIQ